MENDDKIFGLIAQAEDIQKHAVALQRAAQDAIKTLPEASRNAVRDAAREFIAEGAEKASRGLLDASNEAKTAAATLRQTGQRTRLFQVLLLLAVALVIMGAAYGAGSLLIKNRVAELDELKALVIAEQAKLAELQSKTWGLELVIVEGQRWIRFKTGDSPGEKVNWENGKRQGIEVLP